MLILIGFLGAAALLWLCSLDWRKSVKTALYAVVLEGALRKWVLPQASELIYFLKDGVLLGAYIGYFKRERAAFRSLSSRGGLLGLLVAMVIILFFQLLNPALNSVLVGILGAKGYLLYIPLAFLLPDLFRSTEELQRYLRWYLVFCIPICLLGIAQFFAPADSFLNVYAPSEVEVEVVAFEQGNVRVTGTFPFLVGFGVYLTFNLALLFAVFVHQRRWLWRLALGGVLLLIFVDSLMTGSRSVVLADLLLLAGFVIYSLFETAVRSRWLAIVLIAACGICGVASVGLFPTAMEAFMSRANSDSDSVSQRIGGSFLEPLIGLQYSGLGGYGAGATQVACYALRDQLHLGPPAAFPPPSEGEMLRVMLELGAFGFVVWYGLRLYFLLLLWRTSRSLRQPALRHLALAAFLFHALVFNGQLVTNTTVGVFYWFLAGFAFLLPKLDRSTPGPRKTSRRIVRRPQPSVSPTPELLPAPAASA